MCYEVLIRILGTVQIKCYRNCLELTCIGILPIRVHVIVKMIDDVDILHQHKHNMLVPKGGKEPLSIGVQSHFKG